MEVKKIHQAVFDADETILCANLINANDWVMMMSAGQVFRYSMVDRSRETLFSVKRLVTYSDGGFDLSAPSSIYIMDPVVVVVNDFKRHGFVSYPHKYRAIDLRREDYHANISRYPIALFKDESGTPHLIYSQAWNHLQIMNLDTRRIRTAAKSLIEEHAEEDHVLYYEQFPEDNKLPWPAPYDYFFGQLIMSPDNKRFLSKGWSWGSFDAYNVYDVADFIANSRIAFKNIGHWEHSNRPACWVDSATVVIAYYPSEEEDRSYAKDEPVELHFYDVGQDTPGIAKTVIFDGFEGGFDELYYSNTFNAFIALHKEKGLIVCDMEGQILLKDAAFKPDSFLAELNLFITVESASICVHKLNSIEKSS